MHNADNVWCGANDLSRHEAGAARVQHVSRKHISNPVQPSSHELWLLSQRVARAKRCRLTRRLHDARVALAQTIRISQPPAIAKPRVKHRPSAPQGREYQSIQNMHGEHAVRALPAPFSHSQGCTLATTARKGSFRTGMALRRASFAGRPARKGSMPITKVLP